NFGPASASWRNNRRMIMPDIETVARSIDAIERELRRMGVWQEEPPAPALFAFTMAFAADTMAFTQWLQFVLIPRVRSLIETEGGLPSRSEVGARAAREFDGVDEATDLVRLLGEFDALFD